VIFQKSKKSGLLSIKIHSDGRGKDHFTFPAGGSETPPSAKTLNDENHYYEMNGSAVYDEATKVLPKLINNVLKASDCNIKDIDLFVPHQPSIKTLEKIAELIGLPRSKLMTNMGNYANTAGATLPFLLDQLNSSQKIFRGNKILMATIGSGWTYGAAVMIW
jgi:3-oxoacyl-[acyl-carrier-protein] synthase III